MTVPECAVPNNWEKSTNRCYKSPSMRFDIFVDRKIVLTDYITETAVYRKFDSDFQKAAQVAELTHLPILHLKEEGVDI